MLQSHKNAPNAEALIDMLFNHAYEIYLWKMLMSHGQTCTEKCSRICWPIMVQHGLHPRESRSNVNFFQHKIQSIDGWSCWGSQRQKLENKLPKELKFGARLSNLHWRGQRAEHSWTRSQTIATEIREGFKKLLTRGPNLPTMVRVREQVQKKKELAKTLDRRRCRDGARLDFTRSARTSGPLRAGPKWPAACLRRFLGSLSVCSSLLPAYRDSDML
jgi:hypothetical protein